MVSFVKTLYKTNVNIIFHPQTYRMNAAPLPSLHKSEPDVNPWTQCFLFQLFCFTLLKKVDLAKWNDLISRQADKWTPPSAEGPWGLGDWRWMLHFRTTTWQVPGSMGFVGSERETKHHLWNCNLIDCCSHYPVEFLKLLRAWARKSQRDTERKRWGEAGRKRYGAHVAQRCKALEVPCNSAAPERLAGRQQREKKNPKILT